MKFSFIPKTHWKLKNPLEFALFVCIYGTYFFISIIKSFIFFYQTAQDDHVIQLKLGVVKQKSHFLIKFYKSLILASSIDRQICWLTTVI
jgi:hypothetical protein